jgi:hypothetical protein
MDYKVIPEGSSKGHGEKWTLELHSGSRKEALIKEYFLFSKFSIAMEQTALCFQLFSSYLKEMTDVIICSIF